MGGAEVSLYDMLASLRAAHPDWHLHLVVAEAGTLVERAAALGVTTTVLPFAAALARLGDAGAGGRTAGRHINRVALVANLLTASGAVAVYVKRLRRLLLKLAPDIIHTNGFKMHILGAWARPRHIPLIWHIHDYVGTRPVMARLLRRHARACAAVIANSNSVAQDIKNTLGISNNVHTIYNAVDLERFSPEGHILDLDKLAGLPPAPSGTIKVGLLATLARWKGHETFLRALASLPAASPVRGYIIGGALYQTSGSQHTLDELKQFAAKLNLNDRIGFTGFIDRPEAAMRSLDIIVHASTAPEPFGLVIAEAMACGRAVIVSNAGGASELVDCGVNALCHETGEAGDLVDRIATLVVNPHLRLTMGIAARTTAEHRFQRARLAPELAIAYSQALCRTTAHPTLN